MEVARMAKRPSEPFASALRAAIVSSGLSLDRIRQRLDRLGTPVSTASLSHWQSGRSRPERAASLEAVAVLEEILGKEPGSLLELVGSPRPRGPGQHEPDDDTFFPRSEPARHALDDLGFVTARDFPHQIAVHMGMEIDTASEFQRIRFRVLLRGVAAGQCRLPTIHTMSRDEPNEAPVVTAVEGCRLGRSVSHPEHRVHGSELIVDAINAPGEEAFVEYCVDFRSPHTRISRCAYAVARRCQAILVDVRFHGEETPRECVRFRDAGHGTSTTPVRLDATRRAHASEHGFGPGRIGLRWTWDKGEDLSV